MAVELFSKNIYKSGDFKVAVPVDELPDLLSAVRGIVDAHRAYCAFQEVGAGTQDYSPLSENRPVDVEIYRNRDGKAHVRFTHATEVGKVDLAKIAKVLGIDLKEPICV